MSWLRRRLFARSYRQVEQYAAEWQAHNAQALEQAGPLWLVLGDSAAQAVGASSRATGYVGLVLERLRAHGTLWRVVNLSRSGPAGQRAPAGGRAGPRPGLRGPVGQDGPPYHGLYADGFHPNDRGYLPWAEGVEEAVRRTLQP